MPSSPALDAVIEGTSGAIGAVLSLSLTYPLLTVSTLRAVQQQQQKQQGQEAEEEQAAAAASSPSSSSSCSARAAALMLLAPLRDVREHAARYGWRSLFAGLQPAVAATAVSQGIYFSAYAALRRAAVAHQQQQRQRGGGAASSQPQQQLGVAASILVASAAGCINVLLTNPWWVVVTTMQARAGDSAEEQEERRRRRGGGAVEPGRGPARSAANASSSSSSLAVAAQIWRERGWRGFLAGLGPSLVMVLNPTINYVLYEALVARWAAAKVARRQRGTPSVAPARGGASSRLSLPPAAALSPLEIFALSALSKIGSTLATYPLLVVKSRLQAVKAGGAAGSERNGSGGGGVAATARRLARDEGLGGFYRGLRVKLLQTVLAAAILMATKESLAARTRRSVLALALLVASAPPRR